VEVLWPMDRAVDGGEGQPGPELLTGGSCGVHSWIEGASGDGKRVKVIGCSSLRGGGTELGTNKNLDLWLQLVCTKLKLKHAI